MRAQAAEKVLDASNHIPKSTPEPNNITDWQTVSKNTGKMSVSRAEGYITIKIRKGCKRITKHIFSYWAWKLWRA